VGPASAGRDAGRGGIDLVYGGFPCQDVSVAGKRAGLSGERSALWFEFRRIVSELRPQWVVIENVPGLLSSHRGRDFGIVLGGLADIGYGWAYRVLDARWFGVPQRRRRVFIVGCLGDATRAAAVLAVCESCGGYPAAGRPPRQDVAYALNAGVRGTGDGHGNAWNSNYVTDTASRRIGNAWNTTYLSFSSKGGGGGAVEEGDLAPTVLGTDGNGGVPPAVAWSTKLANTQSNQAGKFYEEYTPALAENSPAPAVAIAGSRRDEGMARPLVARATGYRMDIESENFILDGQNAATVDEVGTLGTGSARHNRGFMVAASPVRASDGHHGWSGGRGDGGDNLVVADPISTREQKTYTHEGKNNFRTHNQIVALRSDAGREGEAKTPSPDAEGRVRLRDPGFNVYEESPTLDATGAHSVGGDFGVRRLTPLECERLQGFPDGWTELTADGQMIADSHRYRMLGNAVATVCAQWLGHRLVWLHEHWDG
jgi:DNA (cytosine-5)-methyltransferase 1